MSITKSLDTFQTTLQNDFERIATIEKRKKDILLKA